MFHETLLELFQNHIASPLAQDYRARLKHFIQVRECIADGPEKALFHLAELYLLRFLENSNTSDSSEHFTHFASALSNWLFEYFTTAPASSGFDFTAFARLLARRRWNDVLRMPIPLYLVEIFEQAPVFGNFSQMQTWRALIASSVPRILDADIREVLSGNMEFISNMDALDWKEKLCLFLTFSTCTQPKDIVSACSVFNDPASHDRYERLYCSLLTDTQSEFFAKLEEAMGSRPEWLWLLVHLQMLLAPATHELNEAAIFRYVNYLVGLRSFSSSKTPLEYLVLCKHGGDTASLLLGGNSLQG